MEKKNMAKAAETREALARLKEAAPLGYTALCKHVCPHAFGLRDSMREKCREWDGCFEPPFCEACWREAIDD